MPLNKETKPNQIETQSYCNRNTTHSNTTEQTRTQEVKVNIETLKRMMSKKKTHYHLSGTGKQSKQKLKK